MSKIVRHPANANLELSKRISNLKNLSELVSSELGLLERYSNIAQLQREDLEEELEDMQEDMQNAGIGSAHVRKDPNIENPGGARSGRLENHLKLTRKESKDA